MLRRLILIACVWLNLGCGSAAMGPLGDAPDGSADDALTVDRADTSHTSDAWDTSSARDTALDAFRDATTDERVDVPFDASVPLADVTASDDRGIAQDRSMPSDSGTRDTGTRDTGVFDTGPRDTGVHDTGVHDTGVRDTGVRDTGVFDTGPRDTGVRDTGVFDTGPRDTGVFDTGPRDTGVFDTGPRDTGVHDTGVRDTGVFDTGPRDTGVRDTGVFDTGPRDTGIPPSDPVRYTGTFVDRTGRFSRYLNVSGESRQVVLNVPSSTPTHPALIVLFHGTNGDGSVVMTESNAVTLSNSQGVIIAAPTSRWIGHGDFDHATEETYWETETDPDPNHNPDVLLVRAIIVEAQRVYDVDPDRVYLMGHSSGGFFAEFAATLLRDRIAAFAENSGGLVRCARRASCGFQGSGTTCATLAMRAGWCQCAGPELPIAVATDGQMPPGYLSHGTRDPLVSVYYTCTLAARLGAVGAAVQTELFDGEGHAVPSNWAQRVWPFLSQHPLSNR